MVTKTSYLHTIDTRKGKSLVIESDHKDVFRAYLDYCINNSIVPDAIFDHSVQEVELPWKFASFL